MSSEATMTNSILIFHGTIRIYTEDFMGRKPKDEFEVFDDGGNF